MPTCGSALQTAQNSALQILSKAPNRRSFASHFSGLVVSALHLVQTHKRHHSCFAFPETQRSKFHKNLQTLRKDRKSKKETNLKNCQPNLAQRRKQVFAAKLQSDNTDKQSDEEAWKGASNSKASKGGGLNGKLYKCSNSFFPAKLP